MEVALRLLTDFDSRWNVRLGDQKRFDPIVQFRNKPNYDLGQGLATNELGYLAPVGLTERPAPGVLRILYVGDSNTVTPRWDHYPVQVESMLEAALGVDVETVNTAVAGYSSANARLLYEHEASRFAADYVFVYLGWNDLGQYGPEGLPYKLHEKGYRISPLQRLLTNVYSIRFAFAAQRVLAQRTPAFDAPLDPRDEALYASYRPTHFVENLRAIVRLARERGAAVYLLGLATLTSDAPTDEELSKAHFPTGMDRNLRKLHQLVRIYDDAVRQVAREEDVPFIDLFALFDSREARRTFTDSCHMDAEGARRIAIAVADAVLAREQPERARGLDAIPIEASAPVP